MSLYYLNTRNFETGKITLDLSRQQDYSKTISSLNEIVIDQYKTPDGEKQAVFLCTIRVGNQIRNKTSIVRELKSEKFKICYIATFRLRLFSNLNLLISNIFSVIFSRKIKKFAGNFVRIQKIASYLSLFLNSFGFLRKVRQNVCFKTI